MPDPVVLDFDDGRTAVGRGAHPDAAAGAAILRRVVEQVAEDLRHAHRVRVDGQHISGMSTCSVTPPASTSGALSSIALRSAWRRSIARRRSVDAATRHARGLQQVVHQAHHVVHLPAHRGAQRLPALCVAVVHRQHVQGIADRCQRVAQLVREHRQEFVLAAHGVGFGVARALELHRRWSRISYWRVARPQRRAQRAEQGRHAQRAFEQRDVAEHRNRVADVERVRAAAGQHQDRQVGPVRLDVQGLRERGCTPSTFSISSAIRIAPAPSANCSRRSVASRHTWQDNRCLRASRR